MNDATHSHSMPMQKPNDSAKDHLSEDEILKQQAERAKAAMNETIEGIKESLRTAADLQLWARHHPWLTVGAAAAAGFAAASVVTSAAQGPPPNGHAPHDGAHAAAGSAPRQQSAVWSSLMAPLFELAKVAIQSSIASAMGGAMQAQAQDQANEDRAEAAAMGQTAQGVPVH